MAEHDPHLTGTSTAPSRSRGMRPTASTATGAGAQFFKAGAAPSRLSNNRIHASHISPLQQVPNSSPGRGISRGSFFTSGSLTNQKQARAFPAASRRTPPERDMIPKRIPDSTWNTFDDDDDDGVPDIAELDEKLGYPRESRDLNVDHSDDLLEGEGVSSISSSSDIADQSSTRSRQMMPSKNDRIRDLRSDGERSIGRASGHGSTGNEAIRRGQRERSIPEALMPRGAQGALPSPKSGSRQATFSAEKVPSRRNYEGSGEADSFETRMRSRHPFSGHGPPQSAGPSPPLSSGPKPKLSLAISPMPNLFRQQPDWFSHRASDGSIDDHSIGFRDTTGNSFTTTMLDVAERIQSQAENQDRLITDMTREVENGRHIILEQSQTIKSLGDNFQVVVTTLREPNERLARQKVKLSSLKDRLETQKEVLTKHETELEKLHRRHEETQLAKQGIQDELSALQTRHAKLEEDHKVAIADYQTQLRSVEDRSRQTELSLREAMNIAKEEHFQHQQALQAQLDEAHRNLENAHTNATALQKQITLHEQTIAENHAQIAKHLAALDQAQIRLDHSRDEINALQTQLVSKTEACAATSLRADMLDNRLVEANKACADLRVEQAQRDEQAEEARQHYMTESRLATEQLGHVKNELIRANQEHQTVATQLSERNSELESARVQINSLSEEVDRSMATIGCLQGQLESMQTQHAKQDEANAELSSEMDRLKSNFEKERADLTDQVSTLHRTHDETKETLDKKIRIMKRLEEQVQAFRDREDVLTAERKALQQQVIDLRAECVEQKANTDQVSKSAQSQSNAVTELKKKVAAQTAEIKQLSHQRSEYEEKIRELVEAHENFKKEAVKHHDEVVEALKQSENLQSVQAQLLDAAAVESLRASDRAAYEKQVDGLRKQATAMQSRQRAEFENEIHAIKMELVTARDCGKEREQQLNRQIEEEQQRAAALATLVEQERAKAEAAVAAMAQQQRAAGRAAPTSHPVEADDDDGVFARPPALSMPSKRHLRHKESALAGPEPDLAVSTPRSSRETNG
ncbi:hypothetical protein CXG81DRAFT_19007 [Caulochytrium protostelioides]|uniref:Uncharacterized protein n=1 Tax=Caulochytrium protostelioides TaxID=1555241 RepID=A0A4P9X7V4_9FUNG|nr:hypothetical protein CXG81DRAFT_19007 [Caulochytrium protostelioides]|eukprot:RKP01140.1 hypothetical protein CXG81DRAFT_19007 [Caulochytrium protostelioides]